MALDRFIEKCNNLGKKVGAKSVSIGFSDDDSKNVEHVRSYFKEKSALSNTLMPHKVKFNLYKTSDRSIEGGERTKFHENSSLPGLASSILPFSKFSNMNDRMFTNNTEQDKSIRLGTEEAIHLANMSKKKIKGKKNPRKSRIRKI